MRVERDQIAWLHHQLLSGIAFLIVDLYFPLFQNDPCSPVAGKNRELGTQHNDFKVLVGFYHKFLVIGQVRYCKTSFAV